MQRRGPEREAWAGKRSGAALAVALLAASACGGARIESGVYHSPKGYRVAAPGLGWEQMPDHRADLAFRHREAPAAMLVNAACGGALARRSPSVLTRHLLSGVRDRVIVKAQEMVPVNGRSASHGVVEGRMDGEAERVRIELYVMSDERCVYDLLFVASPPVFEALRPDFTRVVDSFVAE